MIKVFKNFFSKEQKNVLKNENDYYVFDKIIIPNFNTEINTPLTRCETCYTIASCLDHFDKTKCICGGKYKHFGQGIFIENKVFIKKEYLTKIKKEKQ